MPTGRSGSRALPYYAGSFVLGLPAALLLNRFGPEIGPLGVVALGGAIFAAAHVGFLWYWRGLDEPARAAHKDAVFWGGLAAMYALALAILVLGFEPDLLPFPATAPGRVFAYGVGAAIAGWVAAALVAWAAWWLRRR
jgi:hypothetical protein